MNLQKFYMGESFDAYEYFGAHLEDGGVVFRTYAPNAHGITIVGEFNGWQEQPMEQLHQSGVWVGFSKEAKPRQMYKYVVYGQNGRQEHCDPYGFGMELRPGACSIIRDLTEYQFTDDEWMKKRTRCYDKPLNIYELHLGSWKMQDGQWYRYDEIADELILYLYDGNGGAVGYGFSYRQLIDLKYDGTFGYSGGVGNTGVARLRFTDCGWEYVILGAVEETDSVTTFSWNGELVSEDVFWECFEAQNEKENAKWHPYPADHYTLD